MVALATLVSFLAEVGVKFLVVAGVVAVVAGLVVYGLVTFLRGMFAGEDGDEED